jgi:hypothetical protein
MYSNKIPTPATRAREVTTNRDVDTFSIVDPLAMGLPPRRHPVHQCTAQTSPCHRYAADSIVALRSRPLTFRMPQGGPRLGCKRLSSECNIATVRCERFALVPTR